MTTDLLAKKAPATPSLAPEVTTKEESFRRLLQQDPTHMEANFQLGLIAVRQNRHAEAVAFLKKALEKDPSHSLAHHHLAACYQTLGQSELATQHYHQVVCLKPDYAGGHSNWGIALAQEGKFTEAAAAFAQALRLKPDFHEAHNNWGNVLFEQGKFAESIDQFREALRLHPHYSEAHNNLGLAQTRCGQHDAALQSFREAVRLNPKYPEAHLNMANLCRDRGNLDEAIRCYRQVVQLRPQHRDARLQLAQSLERKGQFEEAIACLYQGLLFNPDTPGTYNHLGIMLGQRDRLDEAAAAFEQSLKLRPDHPETLNLLGNILLRQQKLDEAIHYFKRSLQLKPNFSKPYQNLGRALLQQSRPADAVPQLLEALRLQPDYADAHFTLGNAYRSLNQLDDAIACFRRVLELQPDNGQGWLNLAIVLSEAGKFDEAIERFQEQLRRQPGNAGAHNGLGIVRLHQERLDEALNHFHEALKHKPDDAEIHVNRALTWLRLGDYQQGWAEYEWRSKLKKHTPSPHPQPFWDGSPLPEGTILLTSEQGLGDIIQFARFAPLVKERVGKVLFDCPGPLRGLLASCPGIDGLFTEGTSQPTPDVQISLVSLPRLLGTTVDTVPASTPYVYVDSSLKEQWRDKIGPANGLKVGIKWQGNPQYSGDRYRSVLLEKFRPLAQVPGVQLYSLHKGKGIEQLPPLAEEMKIKNLDPLISADFRDTAAAILNLDLVITIDTAVAHVAGALGVPVWILLPFNSDWRWLRDRDDTIWYPSARLFRQRRWSDWDELFVRVAQALREHVQLPQQHGIAVRLTFQELVEKAIRDALAAAPGSEQSWTVLRQAGVQQTPGLTRLVDSLGTAAQTLQSIETEMLNLAASADLDAKAPELLRRYAQARHQRHQLLEEVVSTAGSTGPR